MRLSSAPAHYLMRQINLMRHIIMISQDSYNNNNALMYSNKNY